MKKQEVFSNPNYQAKDNSVLYASSLGEMLLKSRENERLLKACQFRLRCKRDDVADKIETMAQELAELKNV